MYEVELLNISTNNSFIKIFNSYNSMKKFVCKVKYSKKLILLSITDNSYLYDWEVFIWFI